MAKYLKLFETHTNYETYINGNDAVKPNVSYCEDVNGVYYNPYVREYDKEYLTFVAIEDGTFKFSGNGIYYSLDNGTTWVSLPTNTDTPTVNAGKSILWKGNMQMQPYAGIGSFSSTNKFDVVGNVLSLLYGDNFVGQTTIQTALYSKLDIFNGCTNVVNAENLSLPPTVVTYCYSYMFNGCTSLTTAPQLPATTLADYCYSNMFNGCTSLTTAPQLPATTLAQSCYGSMFNGCTSLTTAPQLPATTLADACYNGMFSGCTSLTSAPQLPATTLAQSCYSGMFRDCTSLTSAPELSATTLAYYCYSSMFQGCTSLTTAPQLPATTLAQSCYGSMFYGCTSLTNAPSILPATTLARECYLNMFNSCTSLTSAPELPATSLTQNYCYDSMFKGCTSLNYIKAMFTTTPSKYLTHNWVEGVAVSGTFVKKRGALWDVTGVSGVPTGWTVQYADS